MATIKGNAKTFDQLKRECEKAIVLTPIAEAYASKMNGRTTNEYTAKITELSTAIAKSVLKKCIDPQGKSAPERAEKATTIREAISNNGINPMLVKLKVGIDHDRKTTDDTRRLADSATVIKFTKEGDMVSEVIDQNAYNALNELIVTTLSDGIDLVQSAATAILEQYADHYNGQTDFLDWRYTVNRLSKRVRIRATDSAEYKDVETSPIQEVYRAVRETIENSRAVQTDPRNGYTYIGDLTDDGLDTIYRRMQRYADIGGENCYGHYTGDVQMVDDYDTTIAKLNLTDRQLTIVNLRMRGYGYKAIASYLGVTHNAVINALKKVQDKAITCGVTPVTK